MSTINPATGLPYPNTTTTATAPATIPTDTGGYISLPVTVDPYQLTADAFGFIANQIPGWVPPEGALETWIIYACARMVAQLAQTAAQVPDVIFEYLGGALMGVPPNQGAAAECQTTWTMVDTSGYTVPAGTVVAFATSGNTVVQYATLQAFSVPEGQTSTAAGAVTVQAAAIGAAANGIAAGPMVIVDQLAFVSSVTSTTTTAGGADPETTAQYLNQLAARFQLLTPRPVLAADFAVMAAQVAGVNRALGIDNYNPYANMLTALDASYGTSGASVGSFTATANCTVATSNAWAETGTYSLSMVATAGGSMTCQSGWYPIAGGETYTAMAFFHAATVAAECAVDLVWGDVNQNVLSTSAGTTSDDSTGGGVQVTNTATAPSNASYLKLQPRVTAGSAGETHDCDERGVLLGTTTTWGPGGAQTGQERMVTVVPVDVNGNALTDDEMAAISTELESLREVNFVVNIVPPTYTAVNVTAAVVCQPSASLATVQAAVVTALQAYLAPGTWAGGGQIPPVWLNDNTVYYLDVAGVIINVPGVHHIVAGSLTVNGGTADVPLDGLAALPQPDINVTVTAAAAGT